MLDGGLFRSRASSSLYSLLIIIPSNNLPSDTFDNIMWNRSEDSANETEWWILLSAALTLLIVLTDNTFTHMKAYLWPCRACNTSIHWGGPVKKTQVWQPSKHLQVKYVWFLLDVYYKTVFNLIVTQISWNVVVEIKLNSLHFSVQFQEVLYQTLRDLFDRTPLRCPWWNINFHNSITDVG